MLPVANISVSRAAEARLKKQRARSHLRDGDVFGMPYIEYFEEPDGSPVKGFVPAYQASSWRPHYITRRWLRVPLPDGLDVYVLPRFKWSPGNRYVLDNAPGDYALYSIECVM